MDLGMTSRRPAGRGRAPLGPFAVLCVAVSFIVLSSAAPASAAEDEDYGLNPTWSDRLSDTMKSSISQATGAIGLGKPQGPPPPESPSGCPTISVLDGTESQRVMAPGGTGNQGLRYQYSLYNVARECTMSGDRMSVKIGADGRVLLGPAGSAGHFDVPIRVVVVSERDQKPVESRLFRVPTSVGAGQAGAPFQFVSDNVVVPIAAGRKGTDYTIKIGFDGKGGGPTVAPGKAHRQKKKKDTESASQ